MVVFVLLFVVSAAATISWCASMSATGGMPMPGGWTMSMMWMRMPGQTWSGAAASFLGMWVVMMAAMMLPSVIPAMRRYRGAVDSSDDARLRRLIALVGVGYFAVWAGFGIAIFPLGAVIAAGEMRFPALARAEPLVAATIVLLAGLVQFTSWKARQLACYCEARDGGRTFRADAGTAWRHGVRLGLHCGWCCANLMTILLVVGAMDPGAMSGAAAAITAERLAPARERVARVIGVVMAGAGLLLMTRAAGLR